MKCATARSLIDERNGRHTGNDRRDNLDFHLASCAACRAYRATRIPTLLDDTTLLTHLLNDTVADSQRFSGKGAVDRTQSHETYHGVLYTAYLSGLNGIARAFQKETHPVTVQGKPVPLRSSPSNRRTTIRSIIRLLLVGAMVIAALTVGGFALAAAMIYRNVQAIVVPTAPLPPRVQTAVIAAAPTKAITIPSPPASPLPQLAGRAPLIPTLLPTTQLPYPPVDEAINILLIGRDQRPDEGENTRGDALIVVRVDPQQQRVALLSLPRDLVVTIPGYGQGRINAANAYGGVELARATVSNLLGLPIHFYATVNFEGFMAIVDAVGGVDITVEKEIYDPAYPTLDYGYTEAHFLPGSQHMDGAAALMYSRVRHADSDYDRILRQQQVLVAIGKRLQQQNMLQSLQSLVTISGALRGYVQTDMPEDTILGLAWSMRSLAPDAVERHALGADQVSENVIPGDPYASFAHPGAISALVQQFIGP